MSDELKAGKVVRIGEGVTLILGDCLAHLPIEADAVVTDPPYGMDYDTDSTRFTMNENGHGEASKRNCPPVHGDDKPFDPSPWLDYRAAVLFGCNHYAARLPVGTTLVWIKKTESCFGTFLSDAEVAWMKGGHGVYCKHDTSLLGETRNRYHPTQKPIALMAWCMERAKIPQGATVLDPYAGSGSTVIACLRTGRNCIAIEKDPTYFAVMVERVKRELSQPFLPSCGTADTDKEGCQDDWLLPTNQKNETDEHGEPE
jgi:DNA modification methylase